MIKKIKDEEYLYLTNHIIDNCEFQKLNNIKQLLHNSLISFFEQK